MKSPKTPDKLSPKQVSKFLPEYLSYAERIRKTLYYGRLPATDRPSLPFTSLCVERFSGACRRGGLEVLDLRTAAHLSYHACPTPASLVIALLYLDRLSPDYLAATPPSRVFLVAMMVASKYLYDDGEEDEVFNDEWATSAALTIQELNQAEREFLHAIDWNLFVDGAAFVDAFEHVEAEVALREGVRRGDFTYTDLASLLHCLTVTASCSTFLNLVSHVLAVCMVGYTAGVVSVVAGTVLAQECCQQVSTVFSQYSTPTTPNDSLTLCSDAQLPDSSLGLVSNSLSSLPDTIDEILDGDEEELNSTSLPGLPSRAITTLTTSILLAMSSPTSKSHRSRDHMRFAHDPGRDLSGTWSKKRRSDVWPGLQSDHGSMKEPFDTWSKRVPSLDVWPGNEHSDLWSKETLDAGRGGACQSNDMPCNPSDLRMSFTTGAFWPPSSLSRSPGGLMLNSGLSQGDAVEQQKRNWVYSNPWVLPWMTWHTAPVYSTVHNFSGNGAANMCGLAGCEDWWVEEWVGWVAWVVVGALADLAPLADHHATPLHSAVFSKVSLPPSTHNHVPLML